MKTIVCALCLWPLLAAAQQPTPTPERTWYWKARLPGGEYIVRLDAIRSVSRHEYLVEGAAKVTEVNIATDSSAIARFYFLEPAAPQTPGGIGQSAVNLLQEKATEALTRAGGEEALTKVIKNYPAATHAHTIEYRLGTRAGLDKLYEHLERAWTRGSGGTFEL